MSREIVFKASDEEYFAALSDRAAGRVLKALFRHARGGAAPADGELTKIAGMVFKALSERHDLQAQAPGAAPDARRSEAAKAAAAARWNQAAKAAGECDSQCDSQCDSDAIRIADAYATRAHANKVFNNINNKVCVSLTRVRARDTDTDTHTPNGDKPGAGAVALPETAGEVLEEAGRQGVEMTEAEAGRFLDYNAAKGWRLNGDRVRDWRRLLKGWSGSAKAEAAAKAGDGRIEPAMKGYGPVTDLSELLAEAKAEAAAKAGDGEALP